MDRRYYKPNIAQYRTAVRGYDRYKPFPWVEVVCCLIGAGLVVILGLTYVLLK